MCNVFVSMVCAVTAYAAVTSSSYFCYVAHSVRVCVVFFAISDLPGVLLHTLVGVVNVFVCICVRVHLLPVSVCLCMVVFVPELAPEKRPYLSVCL